jgi:hypothetical protein
MNRSPQMKGLARVTLAVALVAGWQNPAWAAHELLHAITTRNNVITFYSDAPGTILSAHAVTGLQGSERIRAIDWWNSTIYALGSSSRLYTLDPTTGVATQVGGQFSSLLNGQSFGMDNGPAGVVVVSDLGQNLTIDRATGVATAVGPVLAYAAGDPHAGANPAVTALAYDAGAGTWYAGDSLQNTFATLDPVTGLVHTIGPSGVDFSPHNGLDIAQSQITYLASPAASSDPAANLYTVNKITGAVTLVGLIGAPGDNILVRGLTVAPPACANPPVARPDVMGTRENTVASAPVFKLIANDSSPVGGTLSITSVASPTTQGGTVALVSGGTLVTYTPPLNFAGTDQFTYTLSDTHCTAQGTVNVIVTSANAPSLNNIMVTANPGANFVEFAGIPGLIYVVQFAPTVNGPWTDLSGALVADASGLITYNDLTPPPVRFYRTRVGP